MGKTLRPVPRYSGDKVMADMASRGIDVGRLAALTGKNHMTIRRFLNGEAQTIKTAAAIAAALGTTPRRYFAGVGRAA